MDSVRTGTHWSQSFEQIHYSSHVFTLWTWTLRFFSFQFQDPEFGGLSGGRVVRIAVNPDYQGVKSLDLFVQFLFCFLFICIHAGCNWFPICPPDGLRLQSSPAAADVLRGQVSHHGWEHTLKSKCDHLRQQWGNTIKDIKCIQLKDMRRKSKNPIWRLYLVNTHDWWIVVVRLSACWKRWSLHGRSFLLCCWSWVRGEQRDWTI